ncbi:MAG: sigma-70 family RNA polymerase sigma factor [Candidatus Latescibacterota bacterium]
MPADSAGYADLLRRARSGDRRAFDAIQRSLQGRVALFAERRTGDAAQAEDVTQDAFLSLWVNLGRIRSETHLLPYLYRIVRNLCHDQLRRRQQRRILAHRADAIGLAHALARPPPDEVVYWQQVYGHVRSAMARLPAAHREVLRLRFGEGFTYEQVAEASGVDVGTVKSRLHYARRMLLALLPPDVRRTLGPTQGGEP